MTLPSPLVLWVSALVVGAVGIRRGRGRRTNRARHATGVDLLVRLARTPMPKWLGGRAPARLVADLRGAGLGRDLTPEMVMHAQGAIAVFGLLLAAPLALLSTAAAVVVGVAAAATAVFALRVSIAAAARRRRMQIVGQLPDIIDAVVLCAHAGLPLEPALRLAASRLRGPCADEISATLSQIDLGTPRRDAYTELAVRTGASEVAGLVGALLQAEELGIPISGVLHRQAEILRAGRRQAVRDRAARAAPKVQLVVAMVMVPGALLVVAGVMVVQLIGQIGAVAGAGP